jgi:hypothetical protein
MSYLFVLLGGFNKRLAAATLPVIKTIEKCDCGYDWTRNPWWIYTCSIIDPRRVSYHRLAGYLGAYPIVGLHSQAMTLMDQPSKQELARGGEPDRLGRWEIWNSGEAEFLTSLRLQDMCILYLLPYHWPGFELHKQA